MASLRGRGCAAGLDQPDEGAQASGRQAQDRHDGFLDMGGFGPPQRHHLPLTILPFNDQIHSVVTSQPPHYTNNPSKPGMVRCVHPDPFDLSGIVRRSVLVDV